MNKQEFLEMVVTWCETECLALDQRPPFEEGALRMAKWWAENLHGDKGKNPADQYYAKLLREEALQLAQELLEEEG